MAAPSTVSNLSQCPSIVITENTCYGPELKTAWSSYKSLLDKARHAKPPLMVKTFQDVVMNAVGMVGQLAATDAGLAAQVAAAQAGDPTASSNMTGFLNAIITDMSNKFLGCDKVDVAALIITVLIMVGFLVAVAYM